MFSNTTTVINILRLSYYGRRIGTRMRSIKSCHFQWPWTTPNLVFKVTSLYDAKYLTNGYRYGHSYYRRRIGNRSQDFEWHQFQWLAWSLSQISRYDIIMPPPRGHNAVIGVRRPSVCLSVCLMSRTSALTRKPNGLGRRNFAQGTPGHMRLPHRLQGQKVKRSKVKVTGRRHIVASTNRAATWRGERLQI